MVCDIHCYGETLTSSGWRPLSVQYLSTRHYGVFGFLGNVCNYAMVTPITMPRGLPEDASATIRKLFSNLGDVGHNPSWLSTRELAEFDYEQPLEDRTLIRRSDPNPWLGLRTSPPGEGRMTTYRRLLGDAFFDDVDRLHRGGADRIVYWFDN